MFSCIYILHGLFLTIIHDCVETIERLKLPSAQFVQLKNVNLQSLVQQLYAIESRYFTSEEYKYYTGTDTSFPDLAQHKRNNFLTKLQTLSSFGSSKIVANFFLAIRNMYEQSCETSVDPNYKHAVDTREEGIYIYVLRIITYDPLLKLSLLMSVYTCLQY